MSLTQTEFYGYILLAKKKKKKGYRRGNQGEGIDWSLLTKLGSKTI